VLVPRGDAAPGFRPDRLEAYVTLRVGTRGAKAYATLRDQAKWGQIPLKSLTFAYLRVPLREALPFSSLWPESDRRERFLIMVTSKHSTFTLRY
jgi:hypothetical protein